MDLTGRPRSSGPRGEGQAGADALHRSSSALTAAIHEQRRVAVVINSRSRRGLRQFDVSIQRLRAAGCHLVGTYGVQTLDELKAGLVEALARDPDLVVVGGGDGTVSEAVRHLAYRDIALGILPLGTTNNFARSLGVPMDPVRAIDVLTRGRVIEVDLGRVGELFFANMVSVGLSSHVAARVPAGLKHLAGRAAYLLTATAQLPAHRPFNARVVVGGETHDVSTHQLNMVNGNFHAGLPISRDARADNQVLLVYAMGRASRAGLIAATGGHVLCGRCRPMNEASFLVTDRLWLHTDPVLPLDVDGELVGRTPALVGIAPRALRVMVGSGSQVPVGGRRASAR